MNEITVFLGVIILVALIVLIVLATTATVDNFKEKQIEKIFKERDVKDENQD